MKKLGKFKVGDYWVTRCGEVQQIIHISEDRYEEYPINTDTTSYTREGLHQKGTVGSFDLAKRLDKLTIDYLDYDFVMTPKLLYVGCQEINKKDQLKIFKFLAKHLGYEIND